LLEWAKILENEKRLNTNEQNAEDLKKVGTIRISKSHFQLVLSFLLFLALFNSFLYGIEEI